MKSKFLHVQYIYLHIGETEIKTPPRNVLISIKRIQEVREINGQVFIYLKGSYYEVVETFDSIKKSLCL